MKKMFWIILACVVGVIVLTVIVVFVWKYMAALKNGNAGSVNASPTEEYSELQGGWTQMGSSRTGTDGNNENAGKLQIKNNVYIDNTKECTFTLTGISEDENEYYYNLGIEDARVLTFDGNGGPMEGVLYHTQEVDGHKVRILSYFIEELDGRGVFVCDEYVHDDDLKYIAADFYSDLYQRFEGTEAVPTYVEYIEE